MPTQRRKNTVGEDKPTTSKKKKSVNVVAVITPNGIEGSFKSEPRRPLIAHLFAHSMRASACAGGGRARWPVGAPL